jgi:DNA-binding FadR family transcriptional regulator
MTRKSVINVEIEKVNYKTMADVVETKLFEFLKNNSFKLGDILPSEVELAVSLGVSRNVLREALSRLRMLGMIESKKKRGMVLSSPDILGAMERVMNPLIIDENTLKDIFELRLTLEMGMADILYIRKTNEDIDELEKIALNEKAKRLNEAFRIKNEIDFHGKLYQMTGNDTMQRFSNLLMPVFGYIANLEKVPKIGAVSHLDLVHLLRSSSREDFRQGMRTHLENHFSKLEMK